MKLKITHHAIGMQTMMHWIMTQLQLQDPCRSKKTPAEHETKSTGDLQNNSTDHGPAELPVRTKGLDQARLDNLVQSLQEVEWKTENHQKF